MSITDRNDVCANYARIYNVECVITTTYFTFYRIPYIYEDNLDKKYVPNVIQVTYVLIFKYDRRNM